MMKKFKLFFVSLTFITLYDDAIDFIFGCDVSMALKLLVGQSEHALWRQHLLPAKLCRDEQKKLHDKLHM